MDQATQLRNIIKAQSVANTPSARVITVTSGKGGVGKSNVSINLAVQFKKMGKTRDTSIGRHGFPKHLHKSI